MTILVAGATGTVGRQIVEQLVQAGHPVRALTRNPAAAIEGAQMVVGDLGDPASLIPALEGVEAMHLINFDGGGYTPLQTGEELVELARKAGVKRVTVLLGGELGSIEKALQASDLIWTFVQPVEFMSNAFDWISSVREENTISEPFADRPSAMVHEADIAAVAVVALTEDGHGGATYTVTGPEVLTVYDKVRILGEALGREIGFVELDAEQAQAKWRAAGYPEETIQFFMWVFGNTPEIGYTVVPTVQKLTGRPARTFQQWAAGNASRFVS